MTRPSITDHLATPTMRRLNPALGGGAVGPSARPRELRGSTGAEAAPGRQGAGNGNPRGPRQRKPPAPSNVAEREWVLWLRRAYPDAIVRPHGITFVFPDGDRYTPDAVMWDGGRMTIYEVKAGYRGPGWEQGMERYKRAKAEWCWLDFALAEKRDGVWYVDGVRQREE